MRIKRRLGSTPAQRGSAGGGNCPDVLELEDGCMTGESCPDILETPEGDFAVIGRKAGWLDDLDLAALGASIGEDEAAVIVPRRVLLDAFEQWKKEGE